MDKKQKLPAEEIQERLKDISGWILENGKLHKVFLFKNFVQAFGFMTSCALVAESLNHHPEWFNAYKKVVVDLMTHEADGITSLDFDLAGRMNAIAPESGVL